MKDPNRELTEATARLLGPLQKDLVLVGGCVVGLLISDPDCAPPRETFDVDVITRRSSYAAQTILWEELQALGFRNDQSPGAPICRWTRGEIVLDVMPIDTATFGFGNRWYAEALEHSNPWPNSRAIEMRAISAPYFLATKIEAFAQRGKGIFLGSKDFEDIINVVDGRPELEEEIGSASPVLRDFLCSQIRKWVEEPTIESMLSYCFLPDETSQARIPQALARLRAIAAL